MCAFDQRQSAHAHVAVSVFVFSVLKMAFLSPFAEQFQISSNTVKLLTEEAFDCETAVLGLSEENIKDLEGLKFGERATLWVAAASLQSKAGGGPLVPVSLRPSVTPEDSRRGVVDDIAQRLEGLASAAVAAETLPKVSHL